MKGEGKRPEASSIYVGQSHSKHVSVTRPDMRLVRMLGQLSDRITRRVSICYINPFPYVSLMTISPLAPT
jgi:hypothetical protein